MGGRCGATDMGHGAHRGEPGRPCLVAPGTGTARPISTRGFNLFVSRSLILPRPAAHSQASRSVTSMQLPNGPTDITNGRLVSPFPHPHVCTISLTASLSRPRPRSSQPKPPAGTHARTVGWRAGVRAGRRRARLQTRARARGGARCVINSPGDLSFQGSPSASPEETPELVSAGP